MRSLGQAVYSLYSNFIIVFKSQAPSIILWLHFLQVDFFLQLLLHKIVPPTPLPVSYPSLQKWKGGPVALYQED